MSLDPRATIEANPYLTLDEAASYCRIGSSMLRKQIYLGAGPCVIPVGRRIVFRRKDLDDWLDSLAVEPKKSQQE